MKPPQPPNRRGRRHQVAPRLQLPAAAPAPTRAEPEPLAFPAPPEARRQCGECRLCCKLLSIHEHGHGPASGEPYRFDKPPFQWCTHAGPGGCALHGKVSMPYACASFECEWLLGMGDEADRPDRARMVVVLETDETFGTDGLIACVWEGTPGQHRTPAGVRILRALNARPEITALCVIDGARTPVLFLVRAGPHAGPRAGVSLEERGPPRDIDADRERAFLREVFGEVPGNLDGIRARIHAHLISLPPEQAAAIVERAGREVIAARGRVP